jgi:hypothetical protein
MPKIERATGNHGQLMMGSRICVKRFASLIAQRDGKHFGLRRASHPSKVVVKAHATKGERARV